MIVTVPRGALHDRHRKLAAGEEARLLAVVGDQVRLGERLEEALLLERLDGDAEAFRAIEEEEVQEIAEDQPALLLIVEVRRRELLRGHAARRIRTGREEVDAELLDGAAVDLRDAHLQHHLLALGAAGQLQQVDDAGLARHPLGDLARAQHHGVARHVAGQDDALVVHRDANVLARKELLKRLLERRHAGIDHDVVLTPLVSAPHDQADRAGALAVDQHLARLDDDRIGDRRIRHGDARDVERRVEHRRAAGRQDDPLETAGVGRLRGRPAAGILRRNRRHRCRAHERCRGPDAEWNDVTR